MYPGTPLLGGRVWRLSPRKVWNNGPFFLQSEAYSRCFPKICCDNVLDTVPLRTRTMPSGLGWGMQELDAQWLSRDQGIFTWLDVFWARKQDWGVHGYTLCWLHHWHWYACIWWRQGGGSLEPVPSDTSCGISVSRRALLSSAKIIPFPAPVKFMSSFQFPSK